MTGQLRRAARAIAPLLTALSLVFTGCERGSPLDSRSAGDASPAAGTVDPAAWPEVPAPLPADRGLEERIARIMSTMSLADKVGQVIQADTAASRRTSCGGSGWVRS